MTKKRSLLLTLLLAVVTLVMSCAVFSACKPVEEPKENRTITWTYDANAVTVVASGYDTLPTELLEGTEVSFTITPTKGYEVGTVSTAKKQSDGSYAFTVGARKVTINIAASKIVSEISVKVNKTSYFAYDKVLPADIEVTAKYTVAELQDEVVTGYTIRYQTEGASEFRIGDTGYTVVYGGKEFPVTLDAAITDTQTFNYAELEVNEEGNPVLVVYGHYNVAGATKDEVKTAVEAYATECLERQTWAGKSYTSVATVDDDFNFVLKLTVNEWTATAVGNHYYFRYAIGGVTADGQNINCDVKDPTCVPSDNNNDLSLTTYIGDPIEGKNGTAFYIGNCQDWQGCVMIVAVNANAPAVSISTIALEERDGKAMLLISGVATNMTQEDLAEIYFDYEGTSPVVVPVSVISFNAETGEFTISADVTEASAGTNWLHINATGNNLTDAEIVEGKGTITVGEKSYTLTFEDEWNTGGGKVIVE